MLPSDNCCYSRWIAVTTTDLGGPDARPQAADAMGLRLKSILTNVHLDDLFHLYTAWLVHWRRMGSWNPTRDAELDRGISLYKLKISFKWYRYRQYF